jgi:hypothetical protein
MVDSDKCSLAELREFFTLNGGREVGAKEIMELKKSTGADGQEPAGKGYDQIARGIKNGTFTY